MIQSISMSLTKNCYVTPFVYFAGTHMLPLYVQVFTDFGGDFFTLLVSSLLFLIYKSVVIPLKKCNP